MEKRDHYNPALRAAFNDLALRKANSQINSPTYFATVNLPDIEANETDKSEPKPTYPTPATASSLVGASSLSNDPYFASWERRHREPTEEEKIINGELRLHGRRVSFS